MLIDDVKNNILINESQLGEQLNECIHEGKRSDFSLLLAMLTDDVRAHAQFSLPHSSNDAPATNELNLRDFYNLPKAQQLAIDGLEQITLYNQVHLAKDNKLTELHLLNAITPNPLAFRNDNKYISQDVLGNTSLYCQKKYKEQLQGNVNTKTQLNFNAEQWLNVVNEVVLKESVALTV